MEHYWLRSHIESALFEIFVEKGIAIPQKFLQNKNFYAYGSYTVIQ